MRVGGKGRQRAGGGVHNGLLVDSGTEKVDP